MARSNASGSLDRIYPSEVAARHPVFEARVDCEEPDAGDLESKEERGGNQVERMNEALNAGRGMPRGRR